MKEQNPTQAVILGTLMSGPKHGYDLLQTLSTSLEPTWRISTSQLYLLLKRMEEAGWVQSSLESQETRPPKRVFRLTEAGRNAFLSWLQAPVLHVRNFRMEFLGKLFFFAQLKLPGAEELVRAQLRVLEKRRGNLRRRSLEEKNAFMRMTFGFRVRMVESLLSWLRLEALTFVQENVDGNSKTVPVENLGETRP